MRAHRGQDRRGGLQGRQGALPGAHGGPGAAAEQVLFRRRLHLRLAAREARAWAGAAVLQRQGGRDTGVGARAGHRSPRDARRHTGGLR